MRTLRTVIVTAVVSAAVTVGLGELYLARVQPTPAPVVQVQEDEPGWDCHTMGNRSCGPVR